MQLEFLKKVKILASEYKVTWDETHNGGSFSCRESEITIGTRSYAKDPLFTFSVLSHEILELILVVMGGRFDNGRTGENFLFNFDHQTFENAIQTHAQVMSKFIKQ